MSNIGDNHGPVLNADETWTTWTLLPSSRAPYIFRLLIMLWSKPDRRIGSGLLDHIDWVPLRRVNLGRRWLRLYTVVMIRWAMLSQLRNDYSLCPWLKVWPLWAASISSKPSRCQILSARMRQIVLAPTTSGSTIFVCATITILWETRCELMR